MPALPALPWDIGTKSAAGASAPIPLCIQVSGWSAGAGYIWVQRAHKLINSLEKTNADSV